NPGRSGEQGHRGRGTLRTRHARGGLQRTGRRARRRGRGPRRRRGRDPCLVAARRHRCVVFRLRRVAARVRHWTDVESRAAGPRARRRTARSRSRQPGGPRTRWNGNDLMSRARKTAGRIAFVGTGPGDAGLLTVRAHRLLATASLVITDPDVPAEMVALAPEGAEVRAAVGDPADVA